MTYKKIDRPEENDFTKLIESLANHIHKNSKSRSMHLPFADLTNGSRSSLRMKARLSIRWMLKNKRMVRRFLDKK